MSSTYYDPIPVWGAPTNYLYQKFLAIDNSNQMTDSFHAIKGSEQQLSVCFQADDRTGIYSEVEGEFDIANLGFKSFSFVNCSFSVWNKYRYKTSFTLDPNQLQNISISLPTSSGKMLVDKNFTFTMVNNEGSATLEPGQIVKLDSTGCLLAKADSASNFGIGMVIDSSVTPASVATIQFTNIITITDWTNATGSATLVQGSKYYLSDTTAGNLTTTAPTNVQLVGVAISSTSLLLKI